MILKTTPELPGQARRPWNKASKQQSSKQQSTVKQQSNNSQATVKQAPSNPVSQAIITPNKNFKFEIKDNKLD